MSDPRDEVGPLPPEEPYTLRYPLPPPFKYEPSGDAWPGSDTWLDECRKRVQRLVPRDVSSEVWTFQPWGHRLVVVRPRPEQVSKGGILIPHQYQQQMAIGWVLSVGQDVHIPDPRYGSVSPYSHPIDLVGRMVLFGPHSGAQLKFHSLERDFEGQYMIITSGDIWGVVDHPDYQPDDSVSQSSEETP